MSERLDERAGEGTRMTSKPTKNAKPGRPPEALVDELVDRRQLRALRHFAAGSPRGRSLNDPPFRSQAGEWLLEVPVPLSFDMEEQLDELAERHGVDRGQIVRMALVAIGIGTPDDIVAIRDGTWVYDHREDAKERFGNTA